MKELKYVFIGKAKDFNAFNITVQTVQKIKINREEESEGNENSREWISLFNKI